MSSAFRLLTNRLFLSAAVKKMLVRLVSTLITSSESCGNSSRVRGVGDGDGFACCVLVSSFLADRLLLAIPPHNTRKIRRDNSNGLRYCILLLFTELFTAQPLLYCSTLSAMAL